MFGSKKSAATCSIIDSNMVIKGDIEFNKGLTVYGKIIGNIYANSDESVVTELILHEGSEIVGDIHVPKAKIDGTVTGNVQANGLRLLGHARIIGDVSYEVVEMVEGACIDGSIQHLQPNNIKSSKPKSTTQDKHTKSENG